MLDLWTIPDQSLICSSFTCTLCTMFSSSYNKDVCFIDKPANSQTANSITKRFIVSNPVFQQMLNYNCLQCKLCTHVIQLYFSSYHKSCMSLTDVLQFLVSYCTALYIVTVDIFTCCTVEFEWNFVFRVGVFLPANLCTI